MKDHTTGHVDSNKTQMFEKACDQVRKSLSRLCDDVRQKMLSEADTVYLSMQRDYMSILGGLNVGEISMPREERVIRRELEEFITAADPAFQKVIDDELEGLELSDTSGGEQKDVEEWEVEAEATVESEEEFGENIEEDEGQEVADNFVDEATGTEGEDEDFVCSPAGE